MHRIIVRNGTSRQGGRRRTICTTRIVAGVIAVSAVVAVAGSQLGFWLAFSINAPTSAMMSLVDGALFVIVFAVVRLVRAVRHGS